MKILWITLAVLAALIILILLISYICFYLTFYSKRKKAESDDFVPCSMSRENYEACNSTKRLFTVPGAGHGLSYPVSPEKYLRELENFFAPYLTETKQN